MIKWAFFLFCSSLHALFSGNPSLPELPDKGFFMADTMRFGLRAGYEYERVFHLKLNHGTLRFFNQQGILALNFLNRIELFLGLGELQFTLKDVLHYETKSAFLATIGAKWILFHWGHAAFGIHGEYQRSDAALCKMVREGVPLHTKGSIQLDGWQIGPGISYEWKMLVPYVTLGVFSTKLTLKTPEKIHSVLRNHTPTTFILGLTLTPHKYFEITAEGRFYGETAFALDTSLRF